MVIMRVTSRTLWVVSEPCKSYFDAISQALSIDNRRDEKWVD